MSDFIALRFERIELDYYSLRLKSLRQTPVGGGGGGGGTLIFSYIRRLGPFFGVQNFELQYFLGFSEKRIFFGV